MEIKIKKLQEDAVIPSYAHDTDAGMDMYAVSKKYDKDGNIVYGTGIAMEIPQGYVGLVFPRSSIAKKHIALTNCVGVIDSGYRGEIMAKFKPTVGYIGEDDEYNIGERIVQMIVLPYPKVEFKEVDSLEDSDRGTGGYGSTNGR